MPMTRSDFKKQLQEGLNAVFGLEYRRHAEKWRQYLDVETESKKAYVEDVMMAGFGAAPVKSEGGGVAYDSTSETYTARYIFETIALAFAITEEAEEDGLYGSLGGKLSKALARSMQHTKAVKAANILNNGFTGGVYVGGDAVALFSASHPVKSGGTQSNLLATAADLSETSLEDMLIMIGDAKDDREIPIVLTAQKLVVATAGKFNAHRILFSEGRVETANNDPNAIKQMGLLSGGMVVDERLTDPDAWFVKTDCPDGLKHIVRKAIMKKIEGDFETGNMRYKARERYINGWSNWRGAYGTPGGGS
jgi:hypothetical protein